MELSKTYGLHKEALCLIDLPTNQVEQNQVVQKFNYKNQVQKLAYRLTFDLILRKVFHKA